MGYCFEFMILAGKKDLAVQEFFSPWAQPTKDLWSLTESLSCTVEVALVYQKRGLLSRDMRFPDCIVTLLGL